MRKRRPLLKPRQTSKTAERARFWAFSKYSLKCPTAATEKVGGMVDGKMGAFGIAMAALSIAKSAHNIASSYVKSVRQSGELQKRAGIYRRDNR